MTWNGDDLLAVVEDSPARVAAQDRAGWLALFTRDAVVEDPVGAPAHCRLPGLGPGPGAERGAARNGVDPLGSFYDAFIGPNAIRFEVHRDAFGGNAVARRVTIHTRLAGGLTLAIPAYLLYELAEEDGALRIRRLAAHWPARRTSFGAVTRGLTGLRTLGGQTLRLVRHQGLRGVVGYGLGLGCGLLDRAPARLARFVDAVNAAAAHRDASPLAALCVPGGATLAHPAVASQAPPLSAPPRSGEAAPGEAVPGGRPPPSLPQLVLALTGAGPFRAEAPICSGHHVAFDFASGSGPDAPRGIGILGLTPRSGRIAAARFYLTRAPDPGAAVGATGTAARN